jgi:hypothetical protein
MKVVHRAGIGKTWANGGFDFRSGRLPKNRSSCYGNLPGEATQQRAAADFLSETFRISQRRAARVLGRGRSTLRYRLR